jgi:hypothetical protein
MDKQIQSPHTHAQMDAWIRGLLTIAWIDGRYSDEEQELIKDWMQQELIQANEIIETITPIELAAGLGKDERPSWLRSQTEFTPQLKMICCMSFVWL